MTPADVIGLIVGFALSTGFFVKLQFFVGERARGVRLGAAAIVLLYFAVLFLSLILIKDTAAQAVEGHLYIRPMTTGGALGLAVSAMLGHIRSQKNNRGQKQPETDHDKP
jgi:hypothetical protein